MTPAEIHNGEILSDVEGVQTEKPEEVPRKLTPTKDDLDPEQIAAAMAGEISSWIGGPTPVLVLADGQSQTPMDLVNRLLQLKDPAGNKLLFTRFDLFQCFAIWSRKLGGAESLHQKLP